MLGTVKLGSDKCSGGTGRVIEGGVNDIVFDHLEQVVALGQTAVHVGYSPSPFIASVLQVALGEVTH
jgi:hypothetical protein